MKKNIQTEDIGFAVIDHSRLKRCGMPEVIYCENKTADQITGISKAIIKKKAPLLGTRLSQEKFDKIKKELPKVKYDKLGKTFYYAPKGSVKQKSSRIAVICAGTSDIPVAQEAAVTASIFGNKVTKIYDVGVAGIHRLFENKNKMKNANVLIVVAGMEGALPSVIGGLVDLPVIAVPTSVGYGASFKGVAALLGMLNSCASGVTVVNIDNGFGAACAASRITNLIDKKNK